MNRKAQWLLGTVFASAWISVALPWGASRIDVGSRDVPYRITDGSNTQTGVVRYRAYLHQNIVETGQPWTIKHPRDDRQCRWTIEAYVDRQVCFNSLAGGESCNNTMSKVLPVRVSGSSNGLASFMDHDPCSDLMPRINENTTYAKAQLSARLHELTEEDLKGDLHSTLSGRGVSVTYGMNR